MDKGLLFQFMRVKFQEAGFTPAEIELHMQSFSERYQNKTDEEIEADIKRRGGATRVAAATVERRNTVLMADPDYRAFVESGKTSDIVSEPTDTADSTVPAASKEPMSEAPSAAPANEDDPLASWFSAPAPAEKQADEIPPLFSEQKTEQKKNENNDSDKAATAEMSAVKPNAQTVHSIPLFGESAQPAPTAQPRQPGRAPMPPRANSAADLGHTKIVQMPSSEQTTASSATAASAPTTSYRKEQQAIWGDSADVRDPSAARRPAPRTAQPPRQTAQPTKSEKNVEYSDRGTVTKLQEKTYWGEGTEEGVKRFRIILAVSALPIAALLAVYAVAAVALIALMAVLMGVFVVGLVAEVAVGSLVALVAVIYGVSQLFIVVPIGMFELGLGVAAIGVTMFVGILMYNIAVRLLPFLLRRFIRFQSVFRGFLQDLYYYVKGECYRK